MLYNNGFPMTYQSPMPMVNPYMQQNSYAQMPQNNMNNGMSNMNNMNAMNNMNNMNSYMSGNQGYTNMNSMNNMPNTMPNNMSNYSNFQNGSSYSPIPQIPMGNSNTNNMSTNDIVWVQGEQEVIDYPVGNDSNVMFIDINQMKLYTKDGSNGLIRDFTLIESPESVHRCQQMQQIQNAQFPIVESTAMEVDTERQSQEIMSNIEQKLDARLNDFENRLSQLTMDMNNNGVATTTPSTTKKTMTKK